MLSYSKLSNGKGETSERARSEHSTDVENRPVIVRGQLNVQLEALVVSGIALGPEGGTKASPSDPDPPSHGMPWEPKEYNEIGPPGSDPPAHVPIEKLISSLDVKDLGQISFEPDNIPNFAELQGVMLAICNETNNDVLYHSELLSRKFDRHEKVVLTLDSDGVKAAKDLWKPSNSIRLYTRFADGKEVPLKFTVRKLPGR